jgi:Caspase domain
MLTPAQPLLPRSARIARWMQALMLVLVTGLALAQSASSGDPRVALVIGNGAYTDAPLKNPANDAKQMAEVLRRLGFEVIELRDGRREQMTQAIEQLQNTLKGRRGVGLLYYAGHGVQIDARNYMIPVDAKLRRSADLSTQAVDVNRAIDALRAAGTRLNIVVLDACRDNPFGSISSGRGLAPLDAPSGTLLAYATAPGNVASDGAAGAAHGLYTQHLLKELAAPDTRIEDVFKRVRYAVRQASAGRQIPWESTSLEEDFRFNDGRVVAAARPTPQQIRVSFDEESALWDRIKNSTRADDFYGFLQRYPSGALAEAAHARLNLLSQPTLTVQGAGADGRDQRYTVGGFRVGDVYEQRATITNARGVTTTQTMIHRVRKVGRDRVEVMVETPDLPPPLREQLHVYDGAGGLISVGDTLRLDPPQRPVPGGLMQLGMRWSVAVRGWVSAFPDKPVLTLASAHIAAREKLQLPAGEIDAFRVELSGSSTLPSGGELPTNTRYWVAPGMALPVKSEVISALPGASTKTVVELVKFTRGN